MPKNNFFEEHLRAGGTVHNIMGGEIVPKTGQFHLLYYILYFRKAKRTKVK